MLTGGLQYGLVMFWGVLIDKGHTSIVTSKGSKPILEDFSDCIAEKGCQSWGFFFSTCEVVDISSKHESGSTDGDMLLGFVDVLLVIGWEDREVLHDDGQVR